MTPSVLFVCVKNGGKSQLAAALARLHAGGAVEVHSAGTRPGDRLNAESVASLAEVGAAAEGEYPKPVNRSLLDSVDRVVLLGSEVELSETGRAPVERWATDEPSTRGIEGMERMRLVRDEIDRRVRVLVAELLDR